MKKFHYKNTIDHAELEDEFKEFDFSGVNDFDALSGAIQTMTNRHRKIIRFIRKKTTAPYIDNEVLTLMDNRRKIFNLLQRFPNDFNYHMRLVNLKRSITSKIRFNKEQYYAAQFDDAGSPKKFWEVMKRVISNKSPEPLQCPRIKVNGTDVQDPATVANEFNRFFVNVGMISSGNRYPTPRRSNLPRLDLLRDFRFSTVDSCSVSRLIDSLRSSNVRRGDRVYPVVENTLVSILRSWDV